VNDSIGIINIVIGLAYSALAALAILEMWHHSHERGASRFGLAWTAMALTCGPHHLVHGLHAFEGVKSTGVMLTVVAISTVPAVVFVGLRLEAMVGGRGDRFIPGNPVWLMALPITLVLVAGAVTYSGVQRWVGHDHRGLAQASLALTIVLVVTYSWVGWCIGRTQIRRARTAGGWSASGVSLALVFPTCALTHATYALQDATDRHTFVVDIVAVPAALVFWWVVRSLYLQTMADWNKQPLVGRAGQPRRPAPWATSA
jgi:hypothetical protein